MAAITGKIRAKGKVLGLSEATIKVKGTDVSKLSDYNVDPFGSGPPVNIVTGKEIDPVIVRGLYKASTIDDQKLREFTDSRLVTGSKSIFDQMMKVLV